MTLPGSTTTRRRFIEAIGATAAVGSVSTAADASTAGPTLPDPPADAFVETDGTAFVIEGEPIQFNGMNNFWITHEYEATTDRIDAVFDLFEAVGINLVRIWAHGEGKEGPYALQPEPGEYNEDGLERLDYVVDAARQRGMRLIVTLVDNWTHEGGMLQYAEWTGYESRYEFYTQPEPRQLYKNHIETILTRENVYTGREWRNDPTIALLELANEPRLEQDDVPTDMDPLDPPEHRTILGDWIETMASYVKGLDDNHLVSTGLEGFPYGEASEPYPFDNWDGQDFIAHHDIDSIDACSVHLYPDHWNLSLDEGTELLESQLIEATETIGKPVYLGEFNVNRFDHDLETRNEYLSEWYGVAAEYNCNGVLPWQLVLDDTSDHDGFQLYRDESGDIIEAHASVVTDRSGEWGDSSVIEVGEYDTQDTTDDGLHNDFTGNGETTFEDVSAFADSLDKGGVQDNPDAFDFANNDRIGFADVLELLRNV